MRDNGRGWRRKKSWFQGFRDSEFQVERSEILTVASGVSEFLNSEVSGFKSFRVSGWRSEILTGASGVSEFQGQVVK